MAPVWPYFMDAEKKFNIFLLNYQIQQGIKAAKTKYMTY